MKCTPVAHAVLEHVQRTRDEVLRGLGITTESISVR